MEIDFLVNYFLGLSYSRDNHIFLPSVQQGTVLLLFVFLKQTALIVHFNFLYCLAPGRLVQR